MTQNVNTATVGQTNQASAFRLWVQRIWMENCEERLTVGEDSVTIKQYWNTYKYWLKHNYRKTHNESTNSG
jgi:hypothetical protein